MEKLLVKNKLDEILKSTTWLDKYKIVEIEGNDFTIYFENNEDAEKFALIAEAHGANTSIHSSH